MFMESVASPIFRADQSRHNIINRPADEAIAKRLRTHPVNTGRAVATSAARKFRLVSAALTPSVNLHGKVIRVLH